MYEDFDDGVAKADRTGTGTRSSVFGHQMRFDLREGFPLVTTKKVHLKSIIVELLWFLRGDSNVRWLQERGVTIWDEWAARRRRPGPGVRRAVAQSWPTPDGGHIDQIAEVVKQLRGQPRLAPHHRQRLERGRAAEDGADALPRLLPVLRGRGQAVCQLYQRSADIFLGVPFNIASYALLTHMLAQQCDLDVGDFIWTGGDCHIYSNHAEQVALQLSREPRKPKEVRIGFIPLTDCASVVMASVNKFDKKYGIKIIPTKEASWAGVRDKLVNGELDMAHVLYGLIYGVHLGVGGPQEGHGRADEPEQQRPGDHAVQEAGRQGRRRRARRWPS
jgi:thymidylate synthase